MAVAGAGNYNSIYEDIYTSPRKEAVKKEETKISVKMRSSF